MPWQYSRRTWGAASAGVLATLFLLIGSSVSAGIADTRHNLGSGPGPAGRNNVSDTAEVCVFCHTPHGADINAPAPLWNKRLGAAGVPAGGGSYITYDTLQTPSLDGTVAAVGSISMACLSCHDGTQAMDNVINAPGSGGVLADGGLGPLVECASCHDPHVSSGQPGPVGTGQSSGETFLRISNASSAVCTACHVK